MPVTPGGSNVLTIFSKYTHPLDAVLGLSRRTGQMNRFITEKTVPFVWVSGCGHRVGMGSTIHGAWWRIVSSVSHWDCLVTWWLAAS